MENVIETKMINQEYMGKSELNIKISLPISGDINVKMNTKSECVSFIMTKKETEKTVEIIIKVAKFNEKIPEIPKTVKGIISRPKREWKKKR